ncbi:hypothetical protein V3C99_006141 [Haemonchus contortus]
MVVCREQRAPIQREMVEEDINEVLMEEQQNTPPELKHVIEERCRKTHNEDDPSARRGKQVKYEHAVQNMSADSRNIAFQETACPTGPTSACRWQKHGTTQRATSAHVDTVFNTGTDPLILKEGENVGHWETDKWHDQWGDLNPLLSDEVDHELSGNERLQKLEKLLSANTEAQKLDEEVKLLLKKYQETFSISDRELTQMNLVKMTIDTGECAPIKMRARPVPLGLRPKLKELLTDLLEGKVIEHSKSEWAFPIVLVEKKDGSIRLCVDYRELNKKIKLDAYPLPSIEALLQSLSGKRFFSTLDMCSGYWQIPLADDAKEKSAFATPEGLYQFRVTPFGLSTSPPVFQRLMNTVLGDLLGCEVFCYIDDIMVCTTSKQRHLQLLEEVFQRLTKAGLRLKAQKCHLLKSKVAFLGHVIDGDGVHMDPEKVSVIQDYPVSAANRQATPKLLRYGFLLQKVLLGLLEAGVLSLQSDFVEEVVVLGKGASRSISEDEGHDLLGTSPQTARCGCRQKWY